MIDMKEKLRELEEDTNSDDISDKEDFCSIEEIEREIRRLKRKASKMKNADNPRFDGRRRK